MDIDTSFFTLFRQMFLQGTVAKLGAYAWIVYTCIKAHTDFNDGTSLPLLKDIVKQTGLSERQVHRALKILEEEGLLIKSKEWKRNVYRLREKLVVDEYTMITFDHLPAAFKKARQEIHNYLQTGNAKDAKVIHIERLTINIVQGDQQNTTFNTIDLEKITDPILKEKMRKILEKASPAE
jgi:DNA-binding transcriptional regulator YhcF (GntR family)